MKILKMLMATTLNIKIKRIIALGGETIFYFTDAVHRRNFPEELINHIIILESTDDNQDGQDDGTGAIINIFGDIEKSISFGGGTYSVRNFLLIEKTPYGRSSIEPIAVPKGRLFYNGEITGQLAEVQIAEPSAFPCIMTTSLES